MGHPKCKIAQKGWATRPCGFRRGGQWKNPSNTRITDIIPEDVRRAAPADNSTLIHPVAFYLRSLPET